MAINQKTGGTKVLEKSIQELKGKIIPVLDDGHIVVKEVMGDLQLIVDAARQSYGQGTTKISDDVNLMRYLLRHRHTTPFEMPTIVLHFRIPMDAWRQLIRHRTASVNEYSTRYSIAIDSAQTTAAGDWRMQSQSNKQGSALEFLPKEQGEQLSKQEARLQAFAREVYQERIDAGVAREQARKDLPLSTYTEAMWKMDLHNLLHFLGLRMDLHAQWEIRQYANIIGEIVALWVPEVWEAFVDYRLCATSVSKRAQNTISSMYEMQEAERGIMKSAMIEGIMKNLIEWKWWSVKNHRPSKKSREYLEFLELAKSMGLASMVESGMEILRTQLRKHW